MIVHRYVVVEFRWKRLETQWNRSNVLIYILLVRFWIVMVYVVDIIYNGHGQQVRLLENVQ